MRDEGFYRITWDGMPGVGHCRHVSGHEGSLFEGWNLLFLRKVPSERSHIATCFVGEGDTPRFNDLTVGDHIDGLP